MGSKFVAVTYVYQGLRRTDGHDEEVLLEVSRFWPNDSVGRHHGSDLKSVGRHVFFYEDRIEDRAATVAPDFRMLGSVIGKTPETARALWEWRGYRRGMQLPEPSGQLIAYDAHGEILRSFGLSKFVQARDAWMFRGDPDWQRIERVCSSARPGRPPRELRDAMLGNFFS